MIIFSSLPTYLAGTSLPCKNELRCWTVPLVLNSLDCGRCAAGAAGAATTRRFTGKWPLILPLGDLGRCCAGKPQAWGLLAAGSRSRSHRLRRGCCFGALAWPEQPWPWLIPADWGGGLETEF